MKEAVPPYDEVADAYSRGLAGSGRDDRLRDYLLDRRYRKVVPVDWLPPNAYHRPLGAYVDELAEAGFRVERVVEEHTAGRPQDIGGVPGLLYARATRCEGRTPDF